MLMAGWAVVGLTAGGAVGRLHWRLDYFANFHAQYFVLLAALTVVAVLARAWRHVGLFGLALIYNTVLVWPLLSPVHLNAAHAEAEVGRPALRVVQKNLLHCNEQVGPVADWFKAQDADVIVVQEMTEVWREALVDRLASFELYALPVVRDLGQRHVAGVFVRRGLGVRSHRFLGEAELLKKMPQVQLEVPGFDAPVALVGVHTRAPVSAKWSWLRGIQLDELAEWATTQDGPVLLVGDLNATRWSAPLRDLRHATGLHDTAEGYGLVGTWPDFWAWSGMIILDHVLSSEHFEVIDRRVGPGLGSDHRGVVVDLMPR